MQPNIPVLKLGEIIITALQIDMSDQQVVKFQIELLQSIEKNSAKGVIIDISGLDVVDSFMARVINDTAKAAKFVGAQVAVCGVQPYVAIALVEMGRHLLDVKTTFNLEQAVAEIKQAISHQL